jgi:Dolichyl-phosphate-mannose-protein mannosyltransferase
MLATRLTSVKALVSVWAGHLCFPVLAFCSFRAVLSAVAWFILKTDDALRLGTGLVRSPALQRYSFFDAFFRWDGGWFARIATEGYLLVETANFFPLFSMQGRVLMLLFDIPADLALVLVASINGLIATCFLYLLTCELVGRAVGRWTVACYLCSPFSFFQIAAYPESLGVLLGAGACLLALRGHLKLTMIVCVLAALTRHTTCYAVFAAVLLLVQRRRWLAALLTGGSWCVGLGAFSWFQAVTFKDPLKFVHVRSLWADGFVPLWRLNFQTDPVLLPGAVFAVVAGLASAIFCIRVRDQWPLGLAALIWMAVLVSTGGTGLGRHVSSVWPVFVAAGILFARKPTLATVFVAGGAACSSIIFSAYVRQYLIF